MNGIKIVKEVGVLLIAALMVLSTVVVSADTNDQSPMFMLAGADSQSQQTSVFDPDWIHFDDGTNVNAIGLVDGGTFEFAIRITPTELVGYDGYEITVVRWHHGMEGGSPQPPHSGNIKIYDAGTSTAPGSLITSEPYTVPSTGWFEIPLSNPAPIDASKDIWVSVRVTHAAGEFPAGVAPGPVVAGKGGWISLDGVTWEQLGIDIPTLNYNWNIWAKVEKPSEPPEKPQRPDGPTEGVVGVEYEFSTSTTDPEGEQVSYWWDWDDGTPGEWTDPYDSGATVYASHIWTEVGDYDITVKAKDPHEEESEWSDPKTIHIVDMPILEIDNISGGLLKVSTVIRNIGGIDATRVNWSISLAGGLLIFDGKNSGEIINIPVGDERKISSSLILGFGKTIITITAECAEGSSVTKEQEALVLLFFIIII